MGQKDGLGEQRVEQRTGKLHFNSSLSLTNIRGEPSSILSGNPESSVENGFYWGKSGSREMQMSLSDVSKVGLMEFNEQMRQEEREDKGSSLQLG